MDNIISAIKNKLKIGAKKDNVIVACPKCGCERTHSELFENHMICPECSYYFRVSARDRIEMLTDKNSFNEMFSKVKSEDFLKFPKYQDKLKDAVKKTGENEAVICGTAKIGGQPCCIFIMDPRFIMASMGGGRRTHYPYL